MVAKPQPCLNQIQAKHDDVIMRLQYSLKNNLDLNLNEWNKIISIF